MAQRVVKVVFDAGGFVQAMERIRRATDAHPMGDDESPVEWMRRVIDAAYWMPEGWNGDDSPEATSPASDEEA